MAQDIQARQRTEISDDSFDSFAPLASQSLFWRARHLAASPALGALPLLFWLVENIRPRIAVTIGLADPVAHFALCQAIQKLGLDSMSFGIAQPTEAVASVIAQNDENYPEFSHILQMGHGPAAAVLEDGKIDLLIVNRRADKALLDDLDQHWRPRMSNRGAILFMAGGDDFGTYCDGVANGAGCFTLDPVKGIRVVLCGTEHGDSLTRLCQLRLGRPGYSIVRNVFARVGELHSNTALLTEMARKSQVAADELKAGLTQINGLENQILAQAATLEQARAEGVAAKKIFDIERTATREQIYMLKEQLQVLQQTADAAAQENQNRMNDIATLGLELRIRETQTDKFETSASRPVDRDTKQSEAQSLRAQLQNQQDKQRQTEIERDEAVNRIKDLERSNSWRITAPLRRASLLVRR
jgi:hypothetical protein